MTLVVRRSSSKDRHDVIDVLVSAFGQEQEANLVRSLWQDEMIVIEWVAEVVGKVAGYLAFTKVETSPPVVGTVLGLAPVAVAPLMQKQGVGAALITAAMNDARETASAVVLVGDPEYYFRFGFEPASRKNARWAAMDAGDAFQLLDFTGAFDGVPRTVRYHPAFDGV